MKNTFMKTIDQPFKLLLMMALTWMTSCNANEQSQSPQSHPLSRGHSLCSSIPASECSGAIHCAPIKGRPIQTANGDLCVDFNRQQTVYACRSKDDECGEAFTYARAINQPGQCMWFPTTCIPAGWKLCDIDEVTDCPSLLKAPAENESPY